ncbi:MAG: hypothetical protein JNM63_09160, partial [Spirochaetia bacterium]|nr:hypothetical protein [Spirochaetia bacterium]
MKSLRATFLATLFFLLTSSYIENRGYDRGSLRPYMEKGRSYKDESAFKKHQDETKDLFTRSWETTEFQKMLAEAEGNFETAENRKPGVSEANELESEVRTIIAGWEIDLARDLAKEYGNFKAREVAESDTDKRFLAGIFQKIKDFFSPELDRANAVSSDILANDLSDWRSMVDAGTATKIADQK